MTQTSLLIDAIKKALRQRGVTYAKLAPQVGLSEASVKRLFARRDMRLSRLEEICAVMGIELADLIEGMRAAEGRAAELSEEQEQALVANPKLLLVGLLAINHWSAAQILQAYKLKPSELIGLLTRLDRMRVIDLLPENRMRVRLARNLSWRKGGPIQRFFEQRVQAQFFGSSFLGPHELRLIVHGSLSTRSNALVQQHMRKLAEEFDALVEQDRKLDHAMREGNTLALAIRPWELGLFAELRREPKRDAAGGSAPSGTS
jgi:DNA-binding Xre family transcriptional regulator